MKNDNGLRLIRLISIFVFIAFILAITSCEHANEESSSKVEPLGPHKLYYFTSLTSASTSKTQVTALDVDDFRQAPVFTMDAFSATKIDLDKISDPEFWSINYFEGVMADGVWQLRVNEDPKLVKVSTGANFSQSCNKRTFRDIVANINTYLYEYKDSAQCLPTGQNRTFYFNSNFAPNEPPIEITDQVSGILNYYELMDDTGSINGFVAVSAQDLYYYDSNLSNAQLILHMPDFIGFQLLPFTRSNGVVFYSTNSGLYAYNTKNQVTNPVLTIGPDTLIRSEMNCDSQSCYLLTSPSGISTTPPPASQTMTLYAFNKDGATPAKMLGRINNAKSCASIQIFKDSVVLGILYDVLTDNPLGGERFQIAYYVAPRATVDTVATDALLTASYESAVVESPRTHSMNYAFGLTGSGDMAIFNSDGSLLKTFSNSMWVGYKLNDYPYIGPGGYGGNYVSMVVLAHDPVDRASGWGGAILSLYDASNSNFIRDLGILPDDVKDFSVVAYQDNVLASATLKLPSNSGGVVGASNIHDIFYLDLSKENSLRRISNKLGVQ